jgi:hypothetical protein
MALETAGDARFIVVCDALCYACQTAVLIRRQKHEAIPLMAGNNHRLAHSGIAESADVVLELCCCNSGHDALHFYGRYMAKISILSIGFQKTNPFNKGCAAKFRVGRYGWIFGVNAADTFQTGGSTDADIAGFDLTG